MIQFFVPEVHFAHHMRPVWQALPEEARGAFATSPEQLVAGMPTVVSAWGAYKQVLRAFGTQQPIAFFEHGVGFTYNTGGAPHPSYAGGPGREHVDVFCNVNQIVHEKNAVAYPDTPAAIVGSPKMDRLVNLQRTPTDPATVTFSWHWECKVVPETRSAFPHFKSVLGRAALEGDWTPLGHCHPRGWRWVEGAYRRWRWETEKDFEKVIQRSSLYVCDTSSTIYEAAAVGIPVILLNAPWYRKSHHHGLRFWDLLPGPDIDHPDDLPAAIAQQLAHPEEWEQRRKEITAQVYPYLGESSARAASVLLQHFG